jgi:hypothetical protein
MTPDRIIQQAIEFDVFDEVRAMSERDIPEFVARHRNFIESHPKGYGYFMWKPKIILDTLDRMSVGDILVYCDAGVWLNKNGLPRFNEYLDMLDTSDMVVFSTNDAYKTRQYVKNDVVMMYYPELLEEDMNTCYAGAMIIKKTDASLRLLRDWLVLCETPHFIDSSPSTAHPDQPWFVGQDKDNGLFNICVAKHKIARVIYPDEANIYVGDRQYYHATLDYNGDWSTLDAYPIQCRRLAPREPHALSRPENRVFPFIRKFDP